MVSSIIKYKKTITPVLPSGLVLSYKTYIEIVPSGYCLIIMNIYMYIIMKKHPLVGGIDP